MSRVLGKKEQEERYAKLAQKIHAVINKTWLDPKTGHYATRSQTSEILALALDIVPQKNEQQLIENIAGTINDNGGRLRVGHVGLPGFMESLVDHGLGEMVYNAVKHYRVPRLGLHDCPGRDHRVGILEACSRRWKNGIITSITQKRA